MRMMYEVAVHAYGRELCKKDGPCQGLLNWPKHKWTSITPRPLGLARAKALADSHPHHATVCVWQSAEVAYDNGKAPEVPPGWYPVDARTA